MCLPPVSYIPFQGRVCRFNEKKYLRNWVRHTFLPVAQLIPAPGSCLCNLPMIPPAMSPEPWHFIAILTHRNTTASGDEHFLVTLWYLQSISASTGAVHLSFSSLRCCTFGKSYCHFSVLSAEAAVSLISWNNKQAIWPRALTATLYWLLVNSRNNSNSSVSCNIIWNEKGCAV